MLKKSTSILLLLSMPILGYTQDFSIPEEDISAIDYWEQTLTPIADVNDVLKNIYNNPFKEQMLNNIPAGYPMKKAIEINSFYGFRNHPVHRMTIFHRGIDLRGKIGESAVTTGSGEIIDTGFRKDLGNFVKIRHCYGFESIYGHLSEISVKKGNYVKKGQIIGKVGATGIVTGPHLHYTLKKNNQYIDPFDFLFLNFQEQNLSSGN